MDSGTSPASTAAHLYCGRRRKGADQAAADSPGLLSSGIPALVHEECLTGFTSYGATVYPTAIAWAATFDPDLVERMAAAIGRDMAALGTHQGLSPVLDVVRDYRGGRVEATMGEDPYLVAMLGAPYFRGLQSAGVIATCKHFAGYSASRGARNHGPVPMGPARADGRDPAAVRGRCHAGKSGLGDELLRRCGQRAGRRGPLVAYRPASRPVGVRGNGRVGLLGSALLATAHRVAANIDDAGALALAAGIDVELPDTIGFGAGLLDKVRSGEVPEALVDRAARRVLLQKAELGLLDPEWSPARAVSTAGDIDLDSAENRALAREMAERSVVLLDPGSALPLLGEGRPDLRKVAVVGPCPADPRTFMGCYSFPNHVLPRHPDLGLGIEVPSALDGLRAELTEIEIIHAPGCQILSTDRSGFADAVSAAQQADLCLAFVGDLAGMFGLGTSGRAARRRTCGFPACRPICLTPCSRSAPRS